ncbi:protein ROS1A-like isoform X2 [Tasmannia lanceolata]|uniref:protein ROS1A-like isoform X2 n=1 Tax=Tasmannia lanceolata TaxID=3420 RepID=UPI004062F765
MRLRRGASQPQESGFQPPGTWIPVTPAKPDVPRPQDNRFQAPGSRIPVMPSNPMADRVRDPSNWEASSSSGARNQPSGSNISAYLQALRNVPGWHVSSVSSIPHGQILAFTEQQASVMAAQRDSNGASSSSAILYCPQINGGQLQSNSVIPVMVKQNFLLGTNMLNATTSCPPQMSQCGFPVPYNTNYSPNSIAGGASNGSISYQTAPVTPVPDRGRSLQNDQPPVSVNLFVDERVTQERKQGSPLCIVDAQPKEPVEPCSDQGPSQLIESDTVFSTPLKENRKSDMGEGHGIDLNKTPQQKPKRKKYWPKVIKEGKQKKTPKPVTPKQASNKENPTGKRKYVRKTGPKVSSTPPGNAAGEKSCSRSLNFDSDQAAPPTTVGEKSCKRALNFTRVGDGCPGTGLVQQNGLNNGVNDGAGIALRMWDFNSDSKAVTQDGCEVINNGSGSKSTLPFADALKLQTGKSPAGLAIDLKQASNKENPTGKRKYVRKTGPKVSSTPPGNVEVVDLTTTAGEKSCSRSLNFDSDQAAPPTTVGEKSCKRALNFTRVGDGCPGTGLVQQNGLNNGVNDGAGIALRMWDFNSDSKAVTQDGCEVINNGSGSKSTLPFADALKLQTGKSPAGLAIDLNHSSTQWLDDCMVLPENPNPSTTVSRKEPSRENMKALAREKSNTEITGACVSGRKGDETPMHPYIQTQKLDCMVSPSDAAHKNHTSIAPFKLQSGLPYATDTQHNSNSSPHVLLGDSNCKRKRSEREYSQTVGDANLHSMNPNESHFFSMQAGNVYYGNSSNQTMNFPDIFKKKRMGIGHNDLMSNASSSVTAVVYDGARGTTSTTNKVTATTPLTLQTSIGKPFPQCNIMDAKMTIQSRTSNIPCEAYARSVDGECNQKAQCVYKEVSSFMGAQREITQNEQQAPQGMNTKKRSKGSVRVYDLASLVASSGCSQLVPAPPKAALVCDERKESNIFRSAQASMEALAVNKHAKVKRKGRPKKVAVQLPNSVSYSGANQVCLQERVNVAYAHHPSMIESRGFRSQAMTTSPDLIDEIVHRLKFLNINGSSTFVTAEAQNALVPYGDGKMVPYEGPFNPIKKRRPRAKVDLDLETNRVWKLLMWKEGSEDTEGMDADKEKWWENERRVFRGRAESFIARMHLVQGDRRFSRWKGSVVDSVVGVFLTQNVSDHLSSSAFMALAARFPIQSRSNNTAPHAEEPIVSTEEQNRCLIDLDDTIKLPDRILSQHVCDRGSITLHEVEPIEEKEIANSNESFGSNLGGSTEETSKGKHSAVHNTWQETCRVSPENRMGTSVTVMEGAARAREEVISSQSSVVSSQNSTDSPSQVADRIGSSSESNSEAENLITGFKCTGLDDPTSFVKLLQMAGTTMFRDLYTHGNGYIPSKEKFQGAPNQWEETNCGKQKSNLDRVDGLKASCTSIYNATTQHPHTQHEFKGLPSVPSSDYDLHTSPESGSAVSGEESRCLPSNASEITEIRTSDCSEERNGFEFTVQQRPLSSVNTPSVIGSCAPVSNNLENPSPCSVTEAYLGKHPIMFNNLPRTRTEAPLGHDTSHICSELHVEHATNYLRKARERDFQCENTKAAEPRNLPEGLAQRRIDRMPQANSNFPNHSGPTLGVRDCSNLMDKQEPLESKVVDSNSREEVSSSKEVLAGTTSNISKTNRGKKMAEKGRAFDWDSLRRQACSKGPAKERDSDSMDSLDWEAVRSAQVEEISNTIRERGMNNMLAERIKDFLDRLKREHGSLDLEWLRDVPPDKAKEYLLSVRGLGLKSVECVRLLTLHHLAFPVDTNVGRICVRLGWVPLQPLPESLQLHLLEMYPIQETIQKYLWPRLCKLDQRTLYELHYQLITFGKVFCTKSKPNCNACPMRAECKHFASAFASARLALPGPEEKSLVTSAVPITAEQVHRVFVNPMPLPPPEGSPHSQVETRINKQPGIKICEPIVEEPATPEPESIDTSESAIEDAFWQEDPDEIPTIKLNFEELTLNVQNYMQENNIELQDGDMSKALVALTPEAASIPTPKLKNVSRLRTEHQVYELPDSHPLLAGLDRREPDDPCSYLLAIWTPGETAQSTQPPEICCNSGESGKLCDKNTCFACSSIREANNQTVRGTLLIPCRTAMRGSFPLNGTYFQVNEVFADHDSSLQPIDVPRAWLWNLARRTVFFGTSIPTIFRGLTTEGIQHCFWRGFVCVRGFDQKTRAPRPLMARLHFPSSKLVRTQRNSKKSEE